MGEDTTWLPTRRRISAENPSAVAELILRDSIRQPGLQPRPPLLGGTMRGGWAGLLSYFLLLSFTLPFVTSSEISHWGILATALLLPLRYWWTLCQRKTAFKDSMSQLCPLLVFVMADGDMLTSTLCHQMPSRQFPAGSCRICNGIEWPNNRHCALYEGCPLWVIHQSLLLSYIACMTLIWQFSLWLNSTS